MKKYLLIIAVLLISIIFFFKLIATPFHFWSLDVYDGSPLAYIIIFTVLPKFILFTLFMRWLLSVSVLVVNIKFFLLIIGFFLLLLGIFFALKQKRLTRFFIYSTMAQIVVMMAALCIAFGSNIRFVQLLLADIILLVSKLF